MLFVPRKDTDAEIAVFRRGIIINIPFDRQWLERVTYDKGFEIKLKACECGADKHGFASHSNWCPKA
jgi:hypothetical protein